MIVEKWRKFYYFQTRQGSCPTKKGEQFFCFPYSACLWGPDCRNWNWASAINNDIRCCLLCQAWAGHRMCREGLMQALVAQTLHIPKKGLSSRLALGEFPGNELWALRIFCLIKVFLYALSLRSCNTGVLRQFILTSVMYGEHMFLLWEAGVWTAEVSCKGAACLCDRSLIKTLDTKAQVGFPDWQHFACVVTHHCWEN